MGGGGSTSKQIKGFTAYAPPSIWSAWTVIYNSSGEGSVEIKAEAIGDTHFIGQIEYYGPGGKKVVNFNSSRRITFGNSFANVRVRFKGLPTGTTINGSVWS